MVKGNMKNEELIKKILSESESYVETPKGPVGGQSVGVTTYPYVIKNEDLGIEIKVNYNRANFKNRDLGNTLMELAIMEILKI